MNKMQEIAACITEIIQHTGQNWKEVIAEVERNLKESAKNE